MIVKNMRFAMVKRFYMFFLKKLDFVRMYLEAIKIMLTILTNTVNIERVFIMDII